MIILITTLIHLLISCNNNDDDSNNFDSSTNELINGIWTLESVHGGLEGRNSFFSNNETIEWNFDINNNTLNVVNNIYIESEYSFDPERLKSDIYAYEIKNSNNFMSLIINDKEMGIITISKNKLEVDTGLASDKFLYVFKKKSN